MTVHKGQRVAHRELDEEGGGAKQGVVQETLGQDPALVVLQSGDRKEAFDSRELVPLSGLPGPVILHPRHALALLRTSQARLALLLDAALVALFVSAAIFWGWELRELVLLGVLIIVVALLAVVVLERDAAQGSSGRPR
jgi:hypothetical protein